MLSGVCLFGCDNQAEEITINDLREEINCTINEHIEEEGKAVFTIIQLEKELVGRKEVNSLKHEITDYLYELDEDCMISIIDYNGDSLGDILYSKETGEITYLKYGTEFEW
ncbi:MAG: hypothetical protein IJD46_00275 [Bacilli bacterium]|nr:hypothetical protein [Bacilli bacterium]